MAIVQNQSLWSMPLDGDMASEKQDASVESCKAALESFSPRVCALQDVYIFGKERRMFNETGGFHIVAYLAYDD